MNNKHIYAVKIGLFMAFLVIIDQLSKYLATIYLKGKSDFKIIDTILSLHYLDGGNTGAAWGMFSGKRYLFIIFTLIAIFFICIFIRNLNSLYFETKKIIYNILNIFFVVLMSGAFGNLIDRVVHGYVIDFIYFELIHFPIFNIADCYVTVSCIVIIIICLFKIKEDEFNKIIQLKKQK
ncbi:MAG: signal peptidase II [Eubacterium sp.]|nr:signal peptidase II [Eubacterium sp.]